MTLRIPGCLAAGLLVLFCAAYVRADVMSSSNPALIGQPVTLTIEIDPPSGVTATPTGTVTFTDGGQSIGTATLQNGIAEFTTQFGSAGDHIIVAQYSGDADFRPASSQPFTQHVTEDDLFTISVSPPIIGQQAGASSKVNLTLFSKGGATAERFQTLTHGVICTKNSIVECDGKARITSAQESQNTKAAHNRMPENTTVFPLRVVAGLPMLTLRYARSATERQTAGSIG